MKKPFANLLEPGLIGTIEMRNRIVMPPMGTNFANEDGFVTTKMKDYYEERAKGGVGLIIVAVVSVDHPLGKVMPRQVGISDDKYVPGLIELIDAVHRHDGKVALQLHHGGRNSKARYAGGQQPVGPSAIFRPKWETPREMSVPEIQHVVDCFARAAERARSAGADAVEIHAAHGYLIAQFLSRSANRREDDYGGSLGNRARLLTEVVAAVRKKVGPDYPLICRLDGREFFIEDGISQDEGLETARLAWQAGVDCLHVTGYGGSIDVHNLDAPLVYLPGALVPLAASIKKSVKVPIIAVGRISPELGEKVLRRGDADFIAMGRQLIADPELPNKLASGRVGEIRRCIYCYTCLDKVYRDEDMSCAINVAAGKEADFRIQRTGESKRVLVVGGGPAGMEAARWAATRGHKVTLIEQEKRLGGSLVFAAIVREENEQLIDYLSRQLAELHVEVRLDEKATQQTIQSLGPDTLILASGAIQSHGVIVAATGPNVLNSYQVRKAVTAYLDMPVLGRLLKLSTIRKLSKTWMPIGKRVVIIGGGVVGCELAVFLAERTRSVTLLEEGGRLGTEMPGPFRWLIMRQLQKYNVALRTGVKCYELRDRKVMISTTAGGGEQEIEADTVILATKGIVAAPQELRSDLVKEYFLVGDCIGSGLIPGALLDGATAGLRV